MALGRGLPVVRRFGVLAAMFVVVAGLFWAGVHNLKARRATLNAENRIDLVPMKGGAGDDTSLGGTPAGPPDAEGADLKGKPAPAFKLVDTDGKPVTLNSLKGHPVVLNFWATWCGPCKLEMPWFQEFSAKYKPQGLIVLGLAQDDGASRDDIASAAKKIGVNYPILMPDDAVSKAYGGVEYLPETFYVDKTGKVVTIAAGVPSKDQMEAEIQQTIAAGGA